MEVEVEKAKCFPHIKYEVAKKTINMRGQDYW